MSPVRVRPVDLLLLCVGIRRMRCEFCGHLQCRWLLPRPLRWGLAVVLVGAIYVGSTGPVKWLHDHYRMADETHAWINRWVYWPLDRWVGSPPADDTTLSRSLHAWREWWSPSEESLRANDLRPLDATAGETGLPDLRADGLEPDTFGEAIEHRVGRPTGEPPRQ